MKDNNPLVSVVMCAYNTKAFIQKAVTSILNQTYTNWELLIVDDASTDGTREWLQTLETHPQVRLLFQKENIGYVAAKNFGISQARGTYITQCDSDDYFDERLLELQIGVVNNHPDIHIVACGFYTIDVAGNIQKTRALPQDEILENRVGEYHPFWFPPLLVHRQVYEKVGLFTPYFMGLGDDLYWTVKANETYKIYCLKQPLYYYRYNHNGISKVLNDLRKVTRPMVMKELIRQRRKTGTDWLEKEQFDVLEDYEQKLLVNKKVMSSKYSQLSRKAVEFKNWPEAQKLLRKAISIAPFNKKCLGAAAYYVKKKVGV